MFDGGLDAAMDNCLLSEHFEGRPCTVTLGAPAGMPETEQAPVALLPIRDFEAFECSPHHVDRERRLGWY